MTRSGLSRECINSFHIGDTCNKSWVESVISHTVEFSLQAQFGDLYSDSTVLPKCGSVNCKVEDWESREWRMFGMDLKEDVFPFTWNSSKIERSPFRDVTWRGLLGTWRLIREWIYLLTFRQPVHALILQAPPNQVCTFWLGGFSLSEDILHFTTRQVPAVCKSESSSSWKPIT